MNELLPLIVGSDSRQLKEQGTHLDRAPRLGPPAPVQGSARAAAACPHLSTFPQRSPQRPLTTTCMGMGARHGGARGRGLRDVHRLGFLHASTCCTKSHTSRVRGFTQTTYHRNKAWQGFPIRPSRRHLRIPPSYPAVRQTDRQASLDTRVPCCCCCRCCDRGERSSQWW